MPADPPSSPPRRRLVLPALLAAGTVAGTAWWWIDDPPPSPAPVAPGEPGAQAGTAPDRPVSRAELRPEAGAIPTAESMAPLPPLDAPFDAVRAQLERRAARGDAAAACRLATEYQACENLRYRMSAVDERIRSQGDAIASIADADQRERAMRELAAFGEIAGDNLLREAAHCDGVPAIEPARKIDYWRQAALGGNVAAMVQYANGNAFRHRETLDTLQALVRYRGEAEAIARRAAQAGSAEALLVLANAYSGLLDTGSRSYLAQVVRPDRIEALALYRLAAERLVQQDRDSDPALASLIDDALARLDEDATPDMRADAERRLAERRRAWTPPQPASSLPVRAIAYGGLPDMGPEGCGDAAAPAP
ncbi:hypothetical protein [Coralloluteibacterium stylophorae]|uniref:Uncharacterized protein n=1 Tax=Coralloluteibacterium stylophorae TaxID=1776034 RepID=A0AAP2CBI4_9GAMM|nr:hypothetical protein [Coralloluteibacterium stylophorae]MBS7456517.1 hypothetical protein [Coralloluteibacterium stylophorae]